MGWYQVETAPLPPPSMPLLPPPGSAPGAVPGPSPSSPGPSPSSTGPLAPIIIPGPSSPPGGTVPNTFPLPGSNPTTPGNPPERPRRFPDLTGTNPVSPQKTDLGGIYVPNLLPGITGPEFKEGERPQTPRPADPTEREGFYFTQDLFIVKPNMLGTMQISPKEAPWNGGILPQPSPYSNILFPMASLEWTVSPTFDLGYRLPGQQGEFALNYQFLVSQGFSSASYLGLASQVKSRITQNEVDFLYRSAPTAFGPRLDIRFEIGAKMGFFFYDTLASNALGEGHASNYFFGGGPRFRIDGDFHITSNKRWRWINGLEISALMGQIQQSYSNSVGPYDFAVTAPKTTTTLPVLKYQTGILWVPSFTEGFSVLAGFELDEYWQILKQNQSSGRLQNLGILLQGRLDF